MKIPYAFRKGGVVHVSDVSRGKSCDAYCPVCNEYLIARKGELMSHHFSHYPSSNCYIGESFVHAVAKQKMYEYIVGSESIVVNWRCKFCGDRFSGNLSSRISKVEIESRGFGSLRPDIACYGYDDRLYCIVEIVHTHQPESNVVDFCERKHIPLLKVYAGEFLYNEVFFYVNHFCKTCYENNRHLNKLKPVPGPPEEAIHPSVSLNRVSYRYDVNKKSPYFLSKAYSRTQSGFMVQSNLTKSRGQIRSEIVYLKGKRKKGAL